jgi:hypothetical protein
MTGHPPRVALSLLRRWTSGPRRESLVGDLIEQHAQGRSRLWFWRQTGQAVLCHAVDDARLHVAFVARAIVVSLVLIPALTLIPHALYQEVGRSVWNWSVAHAFDNFRVLWFGRPRWPTPPLMFANCFVAFLVGMIVARTHREHAAAAVLAAAVAWPLFIVLEKLWLLGPAPLGVMWRFQPAWFLVVHLGVPLGVLMGGVLGTPDVQESLSGPEVSG